jgi:hypothetical protein
MWARYGTVNNMTQAPRYLLGPAYPTLTFEDGVPEGRGTNTQLATVEHASSVAVEGVQYYTFQLPAGAANFGPLVGDGSLARQQYVFLTFVAIGVGSTPIKTIPRGVCELVERNALEVSATPASLFANRTFGPFAAEIRFARAQFLGAVTPIQPLAASRHFVTCYLPGEGGSYEQGNTIVEFWPPIATEQRTTGAFGPMGYNTYGVSPDDVEIFELPMMHLYSTSVHWGPR